MGSQRLLCREVCPPRLTPVTCVLLFAWPFAMLAYDTEIHDSFVALKQCVLNVTGQRSTEAAQQPSVFTEVAVPRGLGVLHRLLLPPQPDLACTATKCKIRSICESARLVGPCRQPLRPFHHRIAAGARGGQHRHVQLLGRPLKGRHGQRVVVQACGVWRWEVGLLTHAKPSAALCTLLSLMLRLQL